MRIQLKLALLLGLSATFLVHTGCGGGDGGSSGKYDEQGYDPVQGKCPTNGPADGWATRTCNDGTTATWDLNSCNYRCKEDAACTSTQVLVVKSCQGTGFKVSPSGWFSGKTQYCVTECQTRLGASATVTNTGTNTSTNTGSSSSTNTSSH